MEIVARLIIALVLLLVIFFVFMFVFGLVFNLARGKKTKVLTTILFAFFPTKCTICEKFLWFSFYWGIPFYYIEAYHYGPFPNDHHCIECHQLITKDNGSCSWCNTYIP